MNKITGSKSMFLLLFFLNGVFFSCSESPYDESEKVYELYRMYELPESLSETSGIIIFDSLIWTFNDSGDESTLYGLDIHTGEILHQVHLNNATHVDWEDITQDEEFLYLGDFGNNTGSRTDLCIYKISKDSISHDASQTISCEKISFSYEDQTDFSVQNFSTPYDCEALFTIEDSLYIFTKNWTADLTALYRLPKLPGSYPARKVHEFESEGLVTGADYNQASGRLVLCGYREYVPFVILFENARELNLEEIPKIKTYFFTHFGLQIEGITDTENSIYISAENSSESQALYELRSE